ncbi:sugar ABC transporter substrate-binding protein [Actinopolymorpha sp. B17G11]|uniref:ABC transporter substrate-binding protein n=1 Tax=Actinopolymorpha sp. B17G11 TaxID=3160861 RepID=UPI0032E453B8
MAGHGLTGCNSGSGGGDDVELQFMYWGSSFEQKAVNAMLEQFEGKHAGASAEPLYTPQEYDTKVNTLVASNRAPDVAYMLAPMAYRLGEQGRLVNLFPYLDKHPELADRLPGTYFWYGKDKSFGTQTANEVALLWYNKPVFDEAGVEHPPAEAASAWSWDDLVEAAYKLTYDQEGRRPDETGFDPKQVRQFGVSASVQFVQTWECLLRSNGVDVVDEAGTKCLLDTPEALEVLQNLQDLMYEHRVAPTPVQLGNNAPTTAVQLRTKRIAMVFDGQWILLDMAQSDVDFGIGVLPSYQEPKTTSMGSPSVIFTSTKHLDEAVELYLFHNDPENVDLYKNGLWMPLERKYYTDPDAIASWIDNDVHPPEYKTAVVDYTLNHATTAFNQRLKNMDNINEVLTPALQRVEGGKEPVKDTMASAVPKIDGLLQGWNPTQEL